MAKHTEHYGLTKPEANDFYDVEIGNTNLDVINELIKGNEEAIEDIAGPGRTTETVVGAYAEAQQAAGQVGSVDEKIGNAGDTGGSTTAGSVFAKMNAVLQKFVAVWTDGRAAKLDNLDAAVSSRAAANTALSNGVWTNARAGLLDRLDGTISSRATQQAVADTYNLVSSKAAQITADTILSRVNNPLAAPVIKNVQRGVCEFTPANPGYPETAPSVVYISIATVNLKKAIVVLGSTALLGVRGNMGDCQIELISATSIKITQLNLGMRSVPWQVVEFY